MRNVFLISSLAVFIVLTVYFLVLEESDCTSFQAPLSSSESSSASFSSPSTSSSPSKLSPELQCPTQTPQTAPTTPTNCPTCTPKKDSKLACAKYIKDYMEENGDSFDPNTRDLITFIAEYSLYESVQAKFYDKINEHKFYFKDSKILQEKIDKLATCQHKIQNENISLPNVALCSFQSNSAQYMQEWLVHYILHGITKFYIYDNNGEEDARLALSAAVDPFVQLGLVDVIPWDNRKQQQAVDDCAARVAGKKHDWVTFLDIDEYFTFNNNETCIPEYLVKFVEAHKNMPVGSIALRYRNINIDGAPMHDTSKTLYDQEDFEVMPHKSLKKHVAYVPAIASYKSVHDVVPKDGYFTFNANGEQMHDHKANFEDKSTGEEMYANVELRHYWGLSLEFMLYDKICGGTEEREQFMQGRVKLALGYYHKDVVKIRREKEDKLLREFLFG